MAKQEDSETRLLKWKAEAAKALIDDLPSGGDLLLLGFDGPESADQILSLKPESLTILEEDPGAEDWAQSHSNVKVLKGSWDSLHADLPKYSAILSLESSAEGDAELLAKLCPEDLSPACKEAKEHLQAVQKDFSNVSQAFTDQDIADFYDKQGRQHPEELPSFFSSLLRNDNITQEQYDHAVKKYELKKSPEAEEPSDQLVHFVTTASQHLLANGQLRCLQVHSDSLYENPQFFDHIITNADLDYEEKLVTIQLPNSSAPATEALLLLVRALAE